MRQLLTTGLLWFTAIGCGVMAGVYFTFSAFAMTSFARIGPAAGIAAMNAINVDIVKSLFLPLFMGTTITAAVLAMFALVRWNEPGSAAMLAGAVVYVLGMFVVTMVLNVPMNNALAAVDPSSTEGATLWARYLKEWTAWNHVRTASSLAGMAAFIAAIAAR